MMRRIESEILREAKRLIARHERLGRELAEEKVRRDRRSSDPLLPSKIGRPARWALDDGFDPYLTRARAARIGHSIRASLRDLEYAPRRPCSFEKKKPGGGTRTIAVYQVADSAISKMMFEELLRKNLPLLGARSYAYRQDVSTQDAIHYVKSELLGHGRVFVAEYDFSKYFDTIDHDHIFRILEERFFVAKIEQAAIRGFLGQTPSPQSAYRPDGGEVRTAGIPQGTSISLFLANVAAWELDRELERTGVGFVRYADDTLIWSTDYGRICAAADVIHAEAPTIGVKVNADKSPGVRLLLPRDVRRGEIAFTHHIDYLGYRLRSDGVFLKDTAERKIKDRISQIVFNNLLREPEAGAQRLGRVGAHIDRDYVTAIWQLRRYLYGDLTEKALRRYRQRSAPLPRFKGVMSAYPLIDDTTELKKLDGWIVDCLWLAVRKRGVLLTAAGLKTLPPPHGLARSDLKKCAVRSASTGERVDLRIPSVRRIAAVVQQDTSQYGPSGAASHEGF